MSLESSFSTIRSARRQLAAREAMLIAQARAQGWTENRIARAIGGGHARLRELSPTPNPDAPILQCRCGHENIDHRFYGHNQFRGRCGHIDCDCSAFRLASHFVRPG